MGAASGLLRRQCRRCGLHYVSPRLRPALILEGYQGATDEGFTSQAAQRERTFGRCIARRGPSGSFF